MKISDYGFSAIVLLRLARFTGSPKKRVWSASEFKTLEFRKAKEVIRFFRKLDFTHVIDISLILKKASSRIYERYSKNLYYKLLLKKTSTICNNCDDPDDDDVTELYYKNPSLSKSTIKSAIIRYIETVDNCGEPGSNTYTWSADRVYRGSYDFYAVPYAIKVTKPKFLKPMIPKKSKWAPNHETY